MDKMELRSKRIVDLVEQDPVRGYVLYYFGIRFYEYSEKTLEEVCLSRALNVERVVQEFESPTQWLTEGAQPKVSYPIDVVIEYLKHAHLLFIKYKLPYISKLLESVNIKDLRYRAIVKDLKILFPLFVEDFVRHIHQEEGTLFRYIDFLQKASRNQCPPTKLFYKMERNSLQRFAMEHEIHDDEMLGIRKITQNYQLDIIAPLHLKVIYSALTDLEKSLQIHARIENRILFPKALDMENAIKKIVLEKVKFN